jgi:hypothetical protein
MPDPAIGVSERDLYGYTDNEILPLTRGRAMELFNADHTIYLLYPDNTEELAFTAEEISKHDGLFGIDRGEWMASVQYQSMGRETAGYEGRQEADLLYGDESGFGIYQVKDGAPRECRFASMHELEAQGLAVDRGNYELVYTAPLSTGDTLTNLNRIFDEYNRQPPLDYQGHSPSVSDVIVLQWKGGVSAHYVDSVGFAELPSFTGAEGRQEQAAREAAPESAPATGYTSSQIGNTMDKPRTEQPVAANDASPAKPPPAYTPAQIQPPPQTKGNGPTVAELQAKAEAGEPISVMALLQAIKREQAQAATESRKEAPNHRTERGII